MKIDYVQASVLRPGEWRASYAFNPERKMLAKKIGQVGILYPLLVQLKSSKIIDGHLRWETVMADSPKTEVPVRWVDCDDIDAAILHLQVNRARGEQIPRMVSDTVRQILWSKKYPRTDLRMMLGMSADEFALIAEGTLLKVRKIPEHTYSKAWVPVETSGQTPTADIRIERPPTPDK